MFFGEFDLAFSGWFFVPQQAFVLGQQAVALHDAAHAAGGDLEAFNVTLIFDSHSSMAGVGERMVEYCLLDLCGDAIGMRAFRPRQAVDEALGPVGLEIAPDLLELLAGVAHHLAFG